MDFQYITEIDFQDELCTATVDIVVTHYEKVEGSYNYDAGSDWDYEGYQDLEFTIKELKIEKLESTVYIRSEQAINEVVSDEMYDKLYDWLLAELKNQDKYDF